MAQEALISCCSPPQGGPRQSIVGFSMSFRIRFLAATSSLCLLLTGVTASAACMAPTAPGTFPDGATAALPDMVAGQKSVKEFLAQEDAYIECLDNEAPRFDPKKQYSAKEKETMTAERIEAKKKMDTAEEDKKAVAERFNVQLRAYKAAQAAAPKN